MPIFEYRCASCGERFETLQSRRDEAAPGCPRCGAARAERLLSSFAVLGERSEAPPGPCGSPDCACRRH
ncbi:MAG TPA: zinc ribbon domain-containing protein [Candidatus Eisenbacteria bacterium]|jgi:putative FmdB family regulatory protein